jgi:hypothetical protein
LMIPTGAPLADARYSITGQRISLLRVDAPVLLRLGNGLPQLPLDRPGRIQACDAREPISELYVTIDAADVVAGGYVVLAASDSIEFDFAGAPHDYVREKVLTIGAMELTSDALVFDRIPVALTLWCDTEYAIKVMVTRAPAVPTPADELWHALDESNETVVVVGEGKAHTLLYGGWTALRFEHAYGPVEDARTYRVTLVYAR